MFKKLAVIAVLLTGTVAARAEIRHADIRIFGMD